ncbi:MAG: hypothetical protein WCE21_03350 [Candidatus Babeliales bacterium]
MKNVMLLFTASSTIFMRLMSITPSVEVALEPSWQTITCTDDDQWLRMGTITIEKKSGNSWDLHCLILHWTGPFIENLFGSLYAQMNTQQKFLPIQDHFVCDSIWQQKKQKLIFKLEKPLTIADRTQLHITLHLKKETALVLKQGAFYIDTHTLPHQLQKEMGQTVLIFAHNCS